MTAHRVLAIVATLVVVAALVLWHSHRGSTNHQASSSDRSPNTVAARAAPNSLEGAIDLRTDVGPDADHPAAPAREMIARDPDSAARLWLSRAENVLRARNRKEYGDEVARLMELPYDQAWGPLVEKAKDDVHAALAASFIQSICTAESTRQGQPHGRERPASSFYKNLPDAMKPFIDRIAELHTADYERRVEHCGGVGNGLDLAFMFLDRFFRPDNLEAQIEVAGENDNKPQAIADLRAILAKQDSARGRSVLGDLLMQSDDETESTEGRAMLEQLAPDDPEAANRLAYCLQNGCGGSQPDPAAARSWLEVSAGLGDWLGLSEIEHALADSGDNAGAWAWSVYALDLALDGCFEMISPSHIHIAAAARTEAQRKAVLTPTEQNAGLAINYAISGRWEKRARQRLSCD